jgi:hypothetical protein
MNGDTQAVMQSISDARAEMLKAIGDLHQEFSGFKGNMEARVSAIEEEQDKTDRRQWIHSLVVTAGAFLHHDLGQWLHWKF